MIPNQLSELEKKIHVTNLSGECSCPNRNPSRPGRAVEHHEHPWILTSSVIVGYVACSMVNEAVQQLKRAYYVLKGIEFQRVSDEDESSFSWYEKME